MVDRAKALDRALNTQRVARYRARKAGLLPPIPLCPCCGHQVRTDRWEGLCATCGRGPMRRAAEAVLRELRWEERPGASEPHRLTLTPPPASAAPPSAPPAASSAATPARS